MRKLLSFIALACAMILAFGANAPSARAGALTSSVLALKLEQPNLVEKAYYRCWWRYGYRHCGYRHGWRHRYWRHHHWRQRYWRRHHYYGYYNGYRPYRSYASEDGEYNPYRRGYYTADGEYHLYRRHYYYNSYRHPTNRPYAYCIGLCWW
jgi:hypothetical protein